jgi:hypothetical protein
MPVKRWFFFLLRYPESGEQVLALVFRTIHYCSIFIDRVYFILSMNFYRLQLDFLNKYVTHESRSPDLYHAALDGIQGIANAVGVCQKEQPDHVFPLKAFFFGII